CLEICYLAKGTQLYRVGGHEYVLTGGDVFVTFPDEQHGTGESPEEKGHLYWLIVKVPGKAGAFLNCAPEDGRKLTQQLLSMPRRHFAGQPELKTILDDVIAACQRRNDPLRHVTIQNRLVDFLLRVIACSHRQMTPGISPAISALLRYIEANAHEPLPVGALAARVGLSVPRFKARFKNEVGIPPAEYVMRRKIDAAKRLLAKPGAMVTTVSFELNFSSSQYFATVVRRYLGCSPRDLLWKA
ncbi:MAG: AraC family transcriptional regulator, partial [Chthoniobacteraceae bacterium]